MQLVGVLDGIWRIRNTRVVDQVARGGLRSVEREGFESGGDLNEIKKREYKRYVGNAVINQNDATSLFTRRRLWGSHARRRGRYNIRHVSGKDNRSIIHVTTM